MPKTPLTAILITLNEKANVARALESVRFADEVIVVDSGSTDGTPEIARRFGAKVVVRDWPGYGPQKNFAQSIASHDWVLSLDADEEVSPELRAEIERKLASPPSETAFELPRKTFYLGRWILHGGWYPNHQVRLYNRTQARWTEPEIHERITTEGQVGALSAPLLHYSFGCIEDQVNTNLRFSRLGFQDLLRKQKRATLAHLICKPIGKFFETYLIKRGFMDGIAGFIISVNAAHSMFLKYAYFFEKDCNENPHH